MYSINPIKHYINFQFSIHNVGDIMTAEEEIKRLKLQKLRLLEKEEEENKLFNEITNDIYLPLYNCRSRYIILYGGAGSGKSIFVGQYVVRKIIKNKGCNWLIVRQTGKTNRISTFPLIKQTINKLNLSKDFKINESDMRIKHIPTGNEIVFAGLDDVEKIKSITFENGNLTDVWIEEASEVEKESFEQIDLRLRGDTNKLYQIIMSYNPTSISLWQKDFIQDWIKQPIQIAELYTAQSKIYDDMLQQYVITELTVLRTTYKQNKYLDAQYRAKLESYKTKDPYFYQVYCLGEYGVTGKTVFNAQKLSLRLQEVKQYKLISGRFKRDQEGIIWVPDVDGNWIVFKQVVAKRFYVIGADVAEGIEAAEGQKEGDYSAAQVLDNNTLEQCAAYDGHIDPDAYADELELAGYYYNTALISVEINMEGGTNRNLERKNYPKLYLREKQDDITHSVESKFGWRTTETSRRLIISDLIEYVRDHTELINDPNTIDEMLTFIRNRNGRPEAQGGKHDDRVMAYAIALQAALSGQQQKAIIKSEYKTYGFSEDALQDFNSVSEHTKKDLITKWNADNNQIIGKVNGLVIAKKNGKRVYI